MVLAEIYVLNCVQNKQTRNIRARTHVSMSISVRGAMIKFRHHAKQNTNISQSQPASHARANANTYALCTLNKPYMQMNIIYAYV